MLVWICCCCLLLHTNSNTYSTLDVFIGEVDSRFSLNIYSYFFRLFILKNWWVIAQGVCFFSWEMYQLLLKEAVTGSDSCHFFVTNINIPKFTPIHVELFANQRIASYDDNFWSVMYTGKVINTLLDSSVKPFCFFIYMVNVNCKLVKKQ